MLTTPDAEVPVIIGTETPSGDLAQLLATLVEEFGQRKAMGSSSPSSSRPHYFLVRTFLGENDLLIILNTVKTVLVRKGS